MTQVNIYEAKTRLSNLLERVEAGEEIIIARNGKPIASLVPLQRKRSPRVPGAWKGKLWIADDFDAPDERINDMFYNSTLVPGEPDKNTASP